MIHIGEDNERRAQEALEQLALKMNKKIKKDLEENGVCFIKDVWKDAFLGHRFDHDDVHGFIDMNEPGK